MNDKFILYDMLNTEKNMKINTATALNEASCDEIYNNNNFLNKYCLSSNILLNSVKQKEQMTINC